MIIDDEADARSYLSTVLIDHGWAARTADSANKGLDLAVKVTEVMTHNPIVTSPATLAAEVVNMMQQNSFNSILAVDEELRPVGALNMHDLLRAGLL